MKSAKTVKSLQSTAKLSNVVGYVFIAICVISAAIGLYNLFAGEDFIVVYTYLGPALGSLGLGAILLTVSAIAEYLAQE